MASLVLDAGPLIKLERRYPKALALIKEAKQRREELLVAGATTPRSGAGIATVPGPR